MRISVVGTGYVGLITGVGFALLDNDVICVDIDSKKTDMINKGTPPIFENNLEEKLQEVINKKLTATTNLEFAINNSDITFIAVGTPSKETGEIDLTYITKATKDIMNICSLKKTNHTIIVKSTVFPGTTEKLAENKSNNISFAMIPEFLKEGHAIDDFFNPDRIVIGTDDNETYTLLEKLHKPLNSTIIKTDIKTAEMIKYASNAFLALKISYANEIGNICKQIDINTYDVMNAVGMDSRISPKFLNAGIGFGGSCFPKDVNALIFGSKKLGYEPKILESVMALNKKQPLKLIKLLEKKSPNSKKITILGIAFKPKTDDIRDAPSIKIVNALLDKNADICVYDPKAMDNFKKLFNDKIIYAKTLNEALNFSNTIMIITEWDEFKNEKLYNEKNVFDGRNILNKKTQTNYEGICW